MEDNAQICNDCGKTFVSKKQLKVHVRHIHTNMEDSVACMACGKTFNNESKLHKHLKQTLCSGNDMVEAYLKEEDQRPDENGKYECNWDGMCIFKVKEAMKLLQHMLDCHGVDCKAKKFYFTDEAKCTTWMDNRVVEEKAKYVHHRTSGSTRTYLCAVSSQLKRSFKTEETPAEKRRSIRRKESKFLTYNCPASIKASMQADGTVEVEHVDYHNHQCSPEDVPLSNVIKGNVEEMMETGFNVDMIWKEMNRNLHNRSNRQISTKVMYKWIIAFAGPHVYFTYI